VPASPPSFIPATEADCARGRRDAAFRRRMMSEHLGRLLAEIKRLRMEPASATRDRQIAEGAALAVTLANLLQK